MDIYASNRMLLGNTFVEGSTASENNEYKFVLFKRDRIEHKGERLKQTKKRIPLAKCPLRRLRHSS